MNTDGLHYALNEITTQKSKGDYASAKTQIIELLKHHTDDYRLYEELCDISLYLEDFETAEKAIITARALNPESITGKYLYGFLLVIQEKFTKGIELLKEADTAYPNNPEILRNLGWAYVCIEEVDKGVMLLKRALNLSPHDYLIMQDLARALFIQGEEKEYALALFERVTKNYNAD